MAEQQTNTSEAAGTLGIARWVQFAFIGVGICAFWLLDNLIYDIWDGFREPDPNLVTTIAAVAAVVGTIAAYRRPKYKTFVTEVSVELAKVRWPTRLETRSQAVVVVIVSIIAAIILGAFDAVWSAVTDLIYDA
jgi:preprotein translocase SecE subunit